MPLPAEPSSKVSQVDARSSTCFGHRRSAKPILTPRTRLHAIKNINKIVRAAKQHQQPPGKREFSFLDSSSNRFIAKTVGFSVSLPLQAVLLKSTSRGQKYNVNPSNRLHPCLVKASPTKMQVPNLTQDLWVTTVKQQRDTGFRLCKGPGRQALLEKSRFCARSYCALEQHICKASNRRQDDSSKRALVGFVQANFNRTSTTSHRKLLHSPIHLSLSASFPDV